MKRTFWVIKSSCKRVVGFPGPWKGMKWDSTECKETLYFEHERLALEFIRKNSLENCRPVRVTRDLEIVRAALDPASLAGGLRGVMTSGSPTLNKGDR